jgi:decaprenylphospho-beta-D-erythro-pentofuranosid-2-ulose 2-reductase
VNDAFGQPQSVLVLGATSDIARAALKQLAAARLRTAVLAGRDQAGLDAAAAEAREAGVTETQTVLFDAHDVGGVDAVVDVCFGASAVPIDLVIVAVGVLGEQEDDEADAARSAEVMTVNYVWPSAALLAVARHLKAQGSGTVMVLSSVAGVRVRRANFIYGSTKTGLDAFALGLADALDGTGARVQVVRPGFVHTKMTAGRDPAPFATTPEAVASAMIAGLESGARVIWAPSMLRYVFFAFKQLPHAIWRRLPG